MISEAGVDDIRAEEFVGYIDPSSKGSENLTESEGELLSVNRGGPPTRAAGGIRIRAVNPVRASLVRLTLPCVSSPQILCVSRLRRVQPRSLLAPVLKRAIAFRT
jgi:hypothetical protein